ncbi:hypothetical protein B7P43_G08332, partial [Cryptotermes secundus]
KLVKCYIWSMALYGAETWTLRAVDQLIGHVLRRNCLLKEVIEGKIEGRIEVTRRRGRRRKMMLDDLGDRRGYSHLKENALDRIKWRNSFERDCGPVVLTDYS